MGKTQTKKAIHDHSPSGQLHLIECIQGDRQVALEVVAKMARFIVLLPVDVLDRPRRPPVFHRYGVHSDYELDEAILGEGGYGKANADSHNFGTTAEDSTTLVERADISEHLAVVELRKCICNVPRWTYIQRNVHARNAAVRLLFLPTLIEYVHGNSFRTLYFVLLQSQVADHLLSSFV